MGKEIVYCGDCGKSLREEEFLKGRAHVLDDRPYCVECRPIKTPAAGPAQARNEPSPRTHATTRATRVTTSTPRVAMPHVELKESRRWLIVGSSVVGAMVLILVILLFSDGGGKPVPPATPPSSGAGSTPVAAPVDKLVQTYKEFEAFVAAEKDPQAILKRCEELRATLEYTPYQARFRDIMERARGQKAQLDRDLAVTTLLDDVDKALREDKAFAKRRELGDRFKSALENAGSRRLDVERARERYERAWVAHDEAARALLRQQEEARLAVSNPLGPYDMDGRGCINNWLVLGPFPNDEDRGLFVDFLRDEETHVPAVGKEVKKANGTAVKWGLHSTTGGKVDFFGVQHLGVGRNTPNLVNYAACWLDMPREVIVNVKVGSDDGYKLWVDGKIVGNEHLHRAAKEDSESYRLKLSKGRRRILIKVDQGASSHEFFMRVVLPDGKRPPGVTVWN